MTNAGVRNPELANEVLAQHIWCPVPAQMLAHVEEISPRQHLDLAAPANAPDRLAVVGRLTLPVMQVSTSVTRSAFQGTR